MIKSLHFPKFNGNISIFDGEIPTSPQHFRPTPASGWGPELLEVVARVARPLYGAKEVTVLLASLARWGLGDWLKNLGFVHSRFQLWFVMELKLSFEALQLSETGRNTARPSVSVLFLWGGLGTWAQIEWISGCCSFGPSHMGILHWVLSRPWWEGDGIGFFFMESLGDSINKCVDTMLIKWWYNWDIWYNGNIVYEHWDSIWIMGILG